MSAAATDPDAQLWPGGLPLEAWELLDLALREALLEKRITPEELHELAGWVEEDE